MKIYISSVSRAIPIVGGGLERQRAQLGIEPPPTKWTRTKRGLRRSPPKRPPGQRSNKQRPADGRIRQRSVQHPRVWHRLVSTLSPARRSQTMFFVSCVGTLSGTGKNKTTLSRSMLSIRPSVHGPSRGVQLKRTSEAASTS